MKASDHSAKSDSSAGTIRMSSVEKHKISSGNSRIRPRPPSLNSRSISTGNNGYPRGIPTPSEVDNEGRSLLPIWALAATRTNPIDHSTNATGVSSSSLKPRQRENSARLMHANMQGSNPRLANSDNGANVDGANNIGRNYFNRHGQRTEVDRATAANSSTTNISHLQLSPRGACGDGARTKQWIRSGNKYFIVDETVAQNSTSPRIRSDSNSSAQKYPLHHPNYSPIRKVHPTAVSSYGTKTSAFTPKSVSPNTKYNLNSPTQKEAPKNDAKSSLSDYAASFASGLYTRRRMATTPGGFPYMPALHLTHKKVAAIEEGGISVASGIDGSAMDGGSSSLLASQRFQNSYLLRSTPTAGSSRVIQDKLRANMNEQDLKKDSKKEISIDVHNDSWGSHQTQKSLFVDDEDYLDLSSYRNPSNSGYDSEGNCEERLKEWKEKFAPSSISKDTVTNRLQIRRVRSLDSDCDSEYNVHMDRLREWKEDQQKNIQKAVASETKVQRSLANSSTTVPSAPTYRKPTNQRHPEQQNLPEKALSQFQNQIELDQQESFGSDNSYDSGTNIYSERLRKWKKEQASIIGTKDNDEDHSEIPASRNWTNAQLPHAGSDSGYDSENSRQQRVKEWKERFAFGLTPEMVQSPEKGVVRYSSISVESGAKRQTAFESLVNEDEKLVTINSPAKVSSRRGREVPGGGIFPVTSPQRKQKDTILIENSMTSPFQSPRRNDSIGQNYSVPNSKPRPLPSLTPPHTLAHGKPLLQNILTPKKSNNATNRSDNDTFSAELQPRREELHVVAKATKFLLGLSPRGKSLSPNEESSTSSEQDCFMTSLGISSPCKVIPSLQFVASADSNVDNDNDPSSPSKGKKGSPSSLKLPKSLNLWKGNEIDFECTDSPSITMKSHLNLHSWNNCLLVRAEGARSGRISLTSTHLIFIYDDDVSDSLLARYGWDRDHIDAFLTKLDGPTSREATPVNLPLDESGEGGGVELIGSRDIAIMDLFENGFEETFEAKPDYSEQSRFMPRNANLVDAMDDSKVDGSSNQSSFGSSQIGSVTNKSIVVKQTHVEGKKQVQHLNEIPPISLSSSSFESFTEYEESQQHGYINKSSSFGDTQPNEDVMSECIIRAINEEAHMRYHQEDDRTSCQKSATAKDISEGANVDQDYTTLYGNQTNVSSFSEVDMDVDPDQERTLYISGDLESKRRHIGIKWPLSKLAEIFDRRYMMKEVGLEIFGPSQSQLTTSSLRQASSTSESTSGFTVGHEIDVPLGPLSRFSLYLVIPGIEKHSISRFRRKKVPRRSTFVEALKEHASQLNDAHWQSSPNFFRKWQWRRNEKNDPMSALTRAWRKGHISNFDYLLRLNAIAGRSFHDPGNYPIMPWVLSNFSSTSVPDLSDERNYRDLSKPMGSQCPERLQKFQEKYASLCTMLDTAIPPFMYGSHYSSTGGVVLHFLVRLRPFAGLHRQLQGGQFDLPDRLFRSVAQAWDQCSRSSTTEVKELTPEWYNDPSFLKNSHNFNLGTSAADGATVSGVILPPWAENNSTKFIEVMRNALESDHCSMNLHLWLDIIFGFKQRGPEAEKANNVFYHLSYYDSDDLANIEDQNLRTEIELHIAAFGSCPTQLFLQPHPIKKVDRKSELHMSSNGKDANYSGASTIINLPTSKVFAHIPISPRRRLLPKQSSQGHF
mmetsp:Transcript_22706/g.34653  ORF Transcript_22706/g.34653 Transcript_22706/m.34653 type:complete len:1674 (+) Transcript_22706:80-5101(+)